MNWLKNLLLRSVCNALTLDKFLQVKFLDKEMTKGKMYENGLLLQESLVKELASEARVMRKLGVYGRVLDSMKSTATDMLVNKSKSIDDMTFAKAMLYTIDVLDKKVENIAKLHG